ncbi:MAG TPA: anaerobic carbon-monoxide dehydrogenase catalytic subunit [Firmicutes bacterium]|nr:anaerobic carbon-monoxide dehydrogenase catalytic subunit [Bacillota bacterium]
MSICRTCHAVDRCPSAHRSTNEMYEYCRSQGIPTIFDRYQSQQPQCGFGMQGICCQLCSHGPCRITHRAERGICGATADTIAARNLLRLAVHGAAAYSHHLEEAIDTLKATALGSTPFRIGDSQKLQEVAMGFGINVAGQSERELALQLADRLLADMHKASREPLTSLSLLAPPSRREVWAKLGVIPGGILSEIRDALTKSMTSINTDPVDLLLTAVRLALATGYLGLMGTITVQDIVLGSPALTESWADLGVIDPEKVNIVAHGHVPFVGTAVIQASRDPEILSWAKEAGAKGINVYGSMCTGQELMQRSAASAGGFAGQLANWIAQEYIIATGAVDLVMMDMNCSIPALSTIAEHFPTRLVSVDKVVRLPGVSEHVDYAPEQVAAQARELIRMAIEAYRRRQNGYRGLGSQGNHHGNGRPAPYLPPYKAKVLAGFGLESISRAFGGSLEPLLAAIADGTIRGVVAVVGCTNNRNGHDTTGLAIMQELIKNNVLVISAGCMSSAAEIESLMDPAAEARCGAGLSRFCREAGIPPVLNFGSCVDIGRIVLAVTRLAALLNVDPSRLPVAVSAPEYLEQKAVADGIFAVAFGLLTHLGPVPPVAGSSLVTRVLTEDIEGLLGGKVLLEQEPKAAAAAMIEHIEAKREALGL